MKYLYIWDDIEVFCEKKLCEKIESEFGEFLPYLNDIENTEFTLIKNKSFKNWASKFKNMDMDTVITIGTRPRTIFFKKDTLIKNIKLKRIISKDGETKKVEFLNGSKKTLLDCIKNQNEIHFFEDVIVSGKTISSICDFLVKNNYSGKVVFHAFIANYEAVSKMGGKYKNISFEINKFMQGTPIKNSTLLCLYDLIFGKLGDKYYKERTDLLELFFNNRIGELKSFIKKFDNKVGVE
ncbi:hypothetical protein [Clostridium perfringens]|uniref:hypothetical protein n=1 Tax=Clostridium perfringens TaxID=1502 RepID=UPI001C87AADF|nr:hypothetical protein [Clostridium perfringens]